MPSLPTPERPDASTVIFWDARRYTYALRHRHTRTTAGFGTRFICTTATLGLPLTPFRGSGLPFPFIPYLPHTPAPAHSPNSGTFAPGYLPAFLPGISPAPCASPIVKPAHPTPKATPPPGFPTTPTGRAGTTGRWRFPPSGQARAQPLRLDVPTGPSGFGHAGQDASATLCASRRALGRARGSPPQPQFSQEERAARLCASRRHGQVLLPGTCPRVGQLGPWGKTPFPTPPLPPHPHPPPP